MSRRTPRVSTSLLVLATIAALPRAGAAADGVPLPGSRLMTAPSIVARAAADSDERPDPISTRDPVCGDQTPRPRQGRRRFLGPLGWLLRSTRDGDDLERSARAFPFYLRSPLLSGLYGCPPESEEEEPEPSEQCAAVTVRTVALEERTVEILLPQLHARSARQLGKVIERGIEAGDVVTLMLVTGERFAIDPTTTRGVAARGCPALV